MMTKECFCKIMEALHSYVERDEKTNKAIATAIFNNQKGKDTVSELDYAAYSLFSDMTVLDDILEVLAVEMNDVENEWISYFVWELDWGKRNTGENALKVWEGTDDIEIPLSTPEELYDLLVKNSKESKKDFDVEEKVITSKCGTVFTAVKWDGNEDTRMYMQYVFGTYFTKDGNTKELKGYVGSEDGEKHQVKVKLGDWLIKSDTPKNPMVYSIDSQALKLLEKFVC